MEDDLRKIENGRRPQKKFKKNNQIYITAGKSHGTERYKILLIKGPQLNCLKVKNN